MFGLALHNMLRVRIYTFFTRSYSIRSVKRSFCTLVIYSMSALAIISSLNSEVSVNDMLFSLQKTLYSSGIDSNCGEMKWNVGLKWLIAISSECTVRPYFKSPTRYMDKLSRRFCVFFIEYTSSIVCEGCWLAPSPAFIIGQGDTSEAYLAAPSK